LQLTIDIASKGRSHSFFSLYVIAAHSFVVLLEIMAVEGEVMGD